MDRLWFYIEKEFTLNDILLAVNLGAHQRINFELLLRDRERGLDWSMILKQRNIQEEKLFLPFRRLHNSEEFPGAGIGLATAKRIIVRHGGEMWGEGVVGKGATLYFTLAKSSAEMLLAEKKITDAEDDVA